MAQVHAMKPGVSAVRLLHGDMRECYYMKKIIVWKDIHQFDNVSNPMFMKVIWTQEHT